MIIIIIVVVGISSSREFYLHGEKGEDKDDKKYEEAKRMRLGSLCNLLRIANQILHNHKNPKTESAQDPDPRHRISMNACKCRRLHP